MKKVITLAMALLVITIAFAQNVSGTYYGVSNGVDVVCKVTHAGSKISGVLTDDASTYVFNGSYSNGYTKGTVVADQMYTFNYTGTFSGSQFKATVIGQNGSISISLSKNKPAASGTTAASASGSRDQKVVGTWMRESVLSSSGYGDYASMVSVTYYRFNSNGTYSITSGGSAASGNNWSSSGSGGDGEYGTWYTKNGYVYTVHKGGTDSRKYTLHNGQLVFGQQGNYKFLSRAN